MLVTFPTSLPDAEDRTRHCGSTLSAIAGQFCPRSPPRTPRSHAPLARASPRFSLRAPRASSESLRARRSRHSPAHLPSQASRHAPPSRGFPARPSFERLPGKARRRELETARANWKARANLKKNGPEGESEAKLEAATKEAGQPDCDTPGSPTANAGAVIRLVDVAVSSERRTARQRKDIHDSS